MEASVNHKMITLATFQVVNSAQPPQPRLNEQVTNLVIDCNQQISLAQQYAKRASILSLNLLERIAKSPSQSYPTILKIMEGHIG